jgi:hypothetical protein
VVLANLPVARSMTARVQIVRVGCGLSCCTQTQTMCLDDLIDAGGHSLCIRGGLKSCTLLFVNTDPNFMSMDDDCIDAGAKQCA